MAVRRSRCAREVRLPERGSRLFVRHPGLVVGRSLPMCLFSRIGRAVVLRRKRHISSRYAHWRAVVRWMHAGWSCCFTAGHGSFPSFSLALAQLKVSLPFKPFPIEPLSVVLVTLSHHPLFFVFKNNRPFWVVLDTRSEFISPRIHVRMWRSSHISAQIYWTSC